MSKSRYIQPFHMLSNILADTFTLLLATLPLLAYGRGDNKPGQFNYIVSGSSTLDLPIPQCPLSQPLSLEVNGALARRVAYSKQCEASAHRSMLFGRCQLSGPIANSAASTSGRMVRGESRNETCHQTCPFLMHEPALSRDGGSISSQPPHSRNLDHSTERRSLFSFPLLKHCTDSLSLVRRYPLRRRGGRQLDSASMHRNWRD